METKNRIDLAAKKLWEHIAEFNHLLCDNIDDSTCQFFCEILKKSNEFARYIDKNFGND